MAQVLTCLCVCSPIAKYVRHHNCRFLCEHCPAHTGAGPPCSYWDMRDNAPFSLAPIPHSLYVSSTPVAERSPWCMIGDFAGEMQNDCPQHVSYNGGVGSDLAAASLKRYMKRGVFGNDDDESRVQRLHGQSIDIAFKFDLHECKLCTHRDGIATPMSNIQHPACLTNMDISNNLCIFLPHKQHCVLTPGWTGSFRNVLNPCQNGLGHWEVPQQFSWRQLVVKLICWDGVS